MTSRSFIPCSLLASLVLACGPTVEPPDQTGGSTTSDTATTAATATNPTNPPPSTTTTGTPPPGMSTGTTASTFSTIDTGDTDDDESSSDGSFIRDPDGGGPCNMLEGFWYCSYCDIWAQDCPAGEKCQPWANDGGTEWNATRCSPIDDDPGQPGDVCTVEGSPFSGIDSCDLGSQCWGVDPQTLQGTCVGMCTGSEDNPLCPSSFSCFEGYDGVIALCLPDCNPLGSDCGPDEICVPTEDSFVCTSARADAAAAGGVCQHPDQCEVGLACIDSQAAGAPCDQGALGCCTPLCDLSAPDPAAGCLDPAQACEPWWVGQPPAGLEDVGACSLPAP